MPNFYADFTYGRERMRLKKIFAGESERAVAREIRERYPHVKIHAIKRSGGFRPAPAGRHR